MESLSRWDKLLSFYYLPMATLVWADAFYYSALSEFANVILNSVSCNTTHLCKFFS